MLDLLLMRASGWKGLPELKTDTSADSKIESTDAGGKTGVEGNKNKEEAGDLPRKASSERRHQDKVAQDSHAPSSEVHCRGDASSDESQNQPAKPRDGSAGLENQAHSNTSAVSAMYQGKAKSRSPAKDSPLSGQQGSDASFGQGDSDYSECSARASQTEYTRSAFTGL